MHGLSGSDFKFSSSGLYGYTESLKKSVKRRFEFQRRIQRVASSIKKNELRSFPLSATQWKKKTTEE